ncbi:carnitine acetyl transferase [Lentinula detonsa]|uniref:Carnitine acetyl transferase n=1 Tax=Lentinula detonsa TaxID=2804962 RepID=A0A9W8P206_9AGAR|nr:carnitine acetyl transferase [Lentinula detonsa]
MFPTWRSNSFLRKFFDSARMQPARQRRNAHWKTSAPTALPGSETFAAQSTLPKLPVPALEATLARLKESLKPIAWNETEYHAVVSKIDEFGAETGPLLQERLLRRQAETDHWLERWWDDGAYLGYRDSLVVNVSYYYGFDDHPSHLRQTPAARAAALARGAMLFRKKLKQGKVTPEGTKEGPFCMDTYRWMFDCCRIPGSDGLDWSKSFAVEGDTGDSGHIVVMRKNRVWKINAAVNGRILSTDEFERQIFQIEHIYKNSTHLYPGVGILTASNRDVWAKDYSELANSEHNSNILETIHSSAFIICLEEGAPLSPEQKSCVLWHGHFYNGQAIGLQNRWVDKPCQFMVYDNMYAGFMGEHSIMDGTPTVRLCDEVLDALASPSFDHGSGLSHSLPIPLDWEVSPTTAQAIVTANAAALDLINSQVLSYHLTSYGKDEIKRFGVSPDSWAQMIIQLAYRRMMGNEYRKGGTYEAATTRKFYKGRTEAIRVVTSESDAWVESMDDPHTNNVNRKELFDLATKKHISLAKLCGTGQGIDRHLLGLKKLLAESEEAPALFSDPVFARSSYWILSTSAIFSKHFNEYGWGEVVPDGFGVAYMTGHNDRLQYTVTSRKEMPNSKFIAEIASAARDLYKLHINVDASKSKL